MANASKEQNDHPEMLGLEKKFVRPGHWYVEGWDVIRSRDQMLDRLMWKITRNGDLLGYAYDLKHADELIDRHRKQVGW